jgi:hypothetical protein
LKLIEELRISILVLTSGDLKILLNYEYLDLFEAASDSLRVLALL